MTDFMVDAVLQLFLLRSDIHPISYGAVSSAPVSTGKALAGYLSYNTSRAWEVVSRDKMAIPCTEIIDIGPDFLESFADNYLYIYLYFTIW